MSWESWWYQCESCGNRQKALLREIDWDDHPVDASAADMNRRTERDMRCTHCGSTGPFQKQGRARDADEEA